MADPTQTTGDPKSPTPGPWRVRGHTVIADQSAPGIGGSDDVAYYGGHLIAESINPPNARLISAAPDLLDALKGVLRVADRKTVEFDAARAAIAKAEGAESHG